MNLKKIGFWVWAIVVLLAVVGCDKDEQAKGTCQADTDCKNGTLCEGGMCIPEAVAKKARSVDAAKKKTDAKTDTEKADESDAEEEEDEGPVPLIPKEKSDPPKLPDWEKAAEINTQHEHGLAKDCSMKVVREWVRVFCRGDILGYQDMEEFGKKHVDYYVSVREKSLSFVARIKQGPKQSLRICRKKDRASLAIYWPMDKERPEHIALGGGKPCENEEYEDGTDEDEDEDESAEEEVPAKAQTCKDLGCAKGKYAGKKSEDCASCPQGYACKPFKNQKRCTCKVDCSN